MKKTIASLLLSGSLLNACGAQPSTSETKVTQVPKTIAKMQSIGNCWIYAMTGWLESLYLQAHRSNIDVSESYWTYWHWYEDIVALRGDYKDYATMKIKNGQEVFDVDTGGNWSIAAGIIQNHGFLFEHEFSSPEARDAKSVLQHDAKVNVAKALMEGGELQKAYQEDPAKFPEVLKAFMNKEFKVDIDLLEKKAIQHLNETQLNSSRIVGTKVSLAELVGNGAEAWRSISIVSKKVRNAKEFSAADIAHQDEVFRRVMTALNNGSPVVMSFRLYWEAFDDETQDNRRVFSYEPIRRILESGEELDPEQQGGHMLMLTDYSVEVERSRFSEDDLSAIKDKLAESQFSASPEKVSLGFGNLDDKHKKTAADFGKLIKLEAKNSWGVTRFDRPLYDGKTDFTRDYLTLSAPYGKDKNESRGLTNFMVPPLPVNQR